MKTTKAFATKAFAIKDPEGRIHVACLSRKKNDVIKSWVGEDICGQRWVDWYRNGYRCIPVTIQEVKK